LINRRPPAEDPVHADRGVAAVEFALVLPVLVLMLTGIVLVGLVFFEQLEVQSAVRDGARAGAIVSDQGCATALSRLQDPSTATCTEVLVCPADGLSEVRIISNRTLSIPMLGDRVVTIEAGAVFECLP
jgi:hypothetical protein|tara:strand:+ start:6940 stop:7326 length:387 start_codon:yes stop_codon:yes gene_type:complete